jgi:hypothetical protein
MLLIVCGHSVGNEAAHPTHQALQESGQTTMMTTGAEPYCETVNLPAPWSATLTTASRSHETAAYKHIGKRQLRSGGKRPDQFATKRSMRAAPRAGGGAGWSSPFLRDFH